MRARAPVLVVCHSLKVDLITLGARQMALVVGELRHAYIFTYRRITMSEKRR